MDKNNIPNCWYLNAAWGPSQSKCYLLALPFER